MNVTGLVSLEEWVERNYRLKRELSQYFFSPLGVNDIPLEYLKTWFKWKKLSARMGYSGPCAWLVRPGFSFLHMAPHIGPCFGGFRVLENAFFLDEPTRESVVFWIPKVLPGTLNKQTRSQKASLDLHRSKFDLPNHHLISFGSASLISGLVLNYHRLTKKHAPFGYFVRTSTKSSDNYRFSFGWLNDELLFELWREDDQRFPILGVFPIGVENVKLPIF